MFNQKAMLLGESRCWTAEEFSGPKNTLGALISGFFPDIFEK